MSIVLSALPQEPPHVPFTAGYHEDRPSAVSSGTGEAASVFRLMQSAGLPVENAVLYINRDDDPVGLLGRPDGYRSKLAFEDRRIDDGTVARNDPGSVHLGGVIEVFPDPEAARTRAQHLRVPLSRSPDHAEYAYLNGRVLLRLSPYLTESAADGYAASIQATVFARPASKAGTR